jgi:hypothetical protein
MPRTTLAATVAMASLSLALASCTPTLTPEQITQIQSGAAAACGFVPTAVQIAGVIPNATVQSGAALVGPIVSAVCSIVTKQSGRLGAGGERVYTTQVSGVTIQFSGHFVASRHSVRRR